MPKKVYIVCEKDVSGDMNRPCLARMLHENNIEHELLAVSQRFVINKPAISREFLRKIAWLCFSTPDSVRLFLSCCNDLLPIETIKIAAQDLSTAALLLQHGIRTDYIPVKPLFLHKNSAFGKAGEIIAAVDGQEWSGLSSAVNMVFTKREGSSFKIQGAKETVFLLNTPREAEYLLRRVRTEATFLCKNPATAEICWQFGQEKVVLPADFTYQGLLTELQKIISG